VEALQTDIIVAGTLAVDYSCDYAPFINTSSATDPVLHTSNPAVITQTLGGVAHNVARAAHLLGASTRLCSAVGDDLNGRAAVAQLAAEGMQTSAITTLEGQRTPLYVAVNDAKKDLVVAMADMGILDSPAAHAELRDTWLPAMSQAKPKAVVVDANWPDAALHSWFKAAKATGALTAFEPVSTAKAIRLFPDTSSLPHAQRAALELPVYPTHHVDIVTPNEYELSAMHQAARSTGAFDRPDWWSVIDALGIPSSGARNRFTNLMPRELVDAGVPQMAVQLLPFVPCVVTKLGKDGVLLTMLLRRGDRRLRSGEAGPHVLARTGMDEGDVGGVYMRLYPPVEVLSEGDVISVNGVGDTFLGALIAGLVRGGTGAEGLVDFAQKAAVLSLRSKDAVSPELNTLQKLL